MRLRFRECDRYFTDTVKHADEYGVDNIWGVSTEREESVLVQGLPVYRSLFVRNNIVYQPPECKSSPSKDDSFDTECEGT